jgi:hypothetical protein
MCCSADQDEQHNEKCGCRSGLEGHSSACLSQATESKIDGAKGGT